MVNGESVTRERSDLAGTEDPNHDRRSRPAQQMVEINELERHLSVFLGHVAWRVAAGPSTASHFIVDFGRKRRLPILKRNYGLRGGRILYQGEYSLFIECGWQLTGVVGPI